MFQKTANCLSEIDFFGKSYNFTFHDKPRYTTTCGGLITIGITIAFITAFWLLGKEVI